MAQKQEWEQKFEEYKKYFDEHNGRYEFKGEIAKEDIDLEMKQYADQLAKIADTESEEYKRIVKERNELKKKTNSKNYQYTFLNENSKQMEKNLEKITKTKETRDIYQSLLDEILEKQEINKKVEDSKKQLGEESKKLEEELKELQDNEKALMKAISDPENLLKHNMNIEDVQTRLDENRKKQEENQHAFSVNQKELYNILQIPVEQIEETAIDELKQDIDKCNKICELLIEGKSMGEIINAVNITKKDNEIQNQEQSQSQEIAGPATNANQIQEQSQETADPATNVNQVQEQSQEIADPATNANQIQQQSSNVRGNSIKPKITIGGKYVTIQTIGEPININIRKALKNNSKDLYARVTSVLDVKGLSESYMKELKTKLENREIDVLLIEGMLEASNKNIISKSDLKNAIGVMCQPELMESWKKVKGFDIEYNLDDVSKGAFLPWNKKTRDMIAEFSKKNKDMAELVGTYDSRNPIKKLLDQYKQAKLGNGEEEKQTTTAYKKRRSEFKKDIDVNEQKAYKWKPQEIEQQISKIKFEPMQTEEQVSQTEVQIPQTEEQEQSH